MELRFFASICFALVVSNASADNLPGPQHKNKQQACLNSCGTGGAVVTIGCAVATFFTFGAAAPSCTWGVAAMAACMDQCPDNDAPPWASAHPLITAVTFEPSFYMFLHDDVMRAFGDNVEKLSNHWIYAGVNEGRRASKPFDPIYYLNTYPDLLAAYGQTGYRQATGHWISFGIREGRRGSLEFDPKFYIDKYPDVKAKYGETGFLGATEHWLSYGIKEGRQASPDFDPSWYLKNNADLLRDFGASGFEAAFNHWVRHGRKEGRRGVE